MDHQLTLTQIKSDLIDLWGNNGTSYTYMQWFEKATLILTKYFNIYKTDFFIFDSDKSSFIQLNGHKSLAMGVVEVPSELIAGEGAQSHTFYLDIFKKEGFEYADEAIVFNNEKFEPLGLLLLDSTEEWNAFSESTHFKGFKRLVSNLVRMIEKVNYLETREKTYRHLFSVAELFNSTMSSEIILDGIITSAEESFPNFEIHLLLSHDQKKLTKSYKLFDYLNERSSTIDAFVSGEVTFEEATDLSANLLNAPIKGRQGIYGVLQVKAPSDYIFLSVQKNFIRMLAKTAGSSLENASLYDQSHRLVEDLQLVNETSKKLNSNLQFNEMLSYLRGQLFKAINPDEIAFVLNKPQGVKQLEKESTDFFRTNEGREYIDFSSTYLSGEEKSLFDAKFSETFKQTVSHESIIAMQIINQEEVVGYIICVRKEPYAFSFEKFKLASLLIGHSSLALANSMLRDQLQKLADKDHLTKLFVRRYLDNIVKASIEQNNGGTFFLLDIDDFKKVNDTYGHSIGDRVLKDVASVIMSEVEGKGIAARWGGEEFAIYLEFMSKTAAEKIAAQLIKKIATASIPAVTVSMGMASWVPGEKVRLRDLFQFTDTALYLAKNNGKNQVVIHDELFTSS